MSFTNNGSKLTGKSITNSFNVIADNITVERNELIKGNLTVLGNTNIGNVTLENGNVNNLTVNNLTVTTPIPYTSGGTGLSTIGAPNQVLTVNPSGTGLTYQSGVQLSNPSTITGTGFTGIPTFNFGIESSGGGNGRGFIRTSATATELVLGSTTSDVLRLSGSGGSANLTYNSTGSSGVFQVTNGGGAITFTNSNSGTISMATAGGSISLGPVSLLTPAVNINTAGGIFNLSTGAGQMDIVTALGIMNIGTGGGPLNISTGVGNLSITATTGILSLTTAAAGAVNIGASGIGLVNLYGSALTISSGAVNLLSGAWTGQTGLWNVTTLAFGLQTASCNISSLASITLQTLVGTIILNGTNTTMNGSTTITASTTPLVMNITGSAPTPVLTCFQASMGTDYSPIFFGKSAASNLSASIRFRNNNASPADNYLGFGFYGNDDLMVLTPTGELFLNGPKLQQSVPGSVTSIPLSILQSTLATSNYMAIQFGRENAVALSGVIQYNHTASISTNSIGFGFTGVNNLMTLNTSGTLSVSGNAYVSQNINWGQLQVNSNTALTVNSPKTILVRGGSGVTITLPNATTLTVGWNYIINNNSNNTITINDFTSTLITTVLSGQLANVYLLTNPNTAGTWDYHLAGSVNSVTATSPIVATGTVNPVISISSTAPISLGPVTITASTTPLVMNITGSAPTPVLTCFQASMGTDYSPIFFGKSAASNLSASIRFRNNNASPADNYLGFGFYGNDDLMILTPTGQLFLNGPRLQQTIPGTSTSVPLSILQPTLASSNFMALQFGRENAVALSGVIQYNHTASTGTNSIGFGFTGANNLMTLNTSGALTVNGNTTIVGNLTVGNTSTSCFLNAFTTQCRRLSMGESSGGGDFTMTTLSSINQTIISGTDSSVQIKTSNTTPLSIIETTNSNYIPFSAFCPSWGANSNKTCAFHFGYDISAYNSGRIGFTARQPNVGASSPDVFTLGYAGRAFLACDQYNSAFFYDATISQLQATIVNGFVRTARVFAGDGIITSRSIQTTDQSFMKCTAPGLGGSNGYFIQFVSDTNVDVGRIRFDGANVLFQSTSDIRTKTNIQPLTNALDKILQLKPSTYTVINTEKNSFGFIADEVYDIIPELVSGTPGEIDDEGNPIYLGLDYGKFTPYTVGAIKDLYSLVQTLQTRITTLESQQ